MTTPLPYETIDQAIEQIKPTIEQLASELWQLAELSLQEVRSMQLIVDSLQAQGFTITSSGTAGVPTAFIAEWGSGTPVIGFLAEYDALPGLGNEPVAHQEPRKDHVTSGHGCGHNLLGAGCIGAAIRLQHADRPPRHHNAHLASHGTSIGVKGAIQAAKVLASTGIDILTDEALRKAARADFEQRVNGKPYISPLPPEMKHPLELPAWLIQDGS